MAWLWAPTQPVQVAVRTEDQILRHQFSFQSVGLLCCHQVRPDAEATAIVSEVSWKLRSMDQSKLEALVILLFPR